MTGLKTSLSLPPEAAGAIDERAAADGISRAEVLRRAVLAYMDQAGPSRSAPAAGEDLAALTADRDRLAVELQTILGDCGRHAAEADRLRADLETRDKAIARMEAEIAWLRGIVEQFARGTGGRE